MLSEYLGQAGYGVTIAALGATALSSLSRERFDAVVLDLMLPDMDGLEVCRRLRARDDTPVLMLTARGDAIDRIVGLEIGADDYLPKPFEPRELLARLRAILRRRVRDRETRDDPAARPLIFGRLEIDPAARAVRLDGAPCELTGYQFDLLAVFARHAGRVLSREFLMDQAKGAELESFDRSIDVHVSRIRAAIEDDPKKPRRLLTVRAAGYVFAKAQD
jgi:DNA-binding response OmpR family regulator